jgi:hypothetical protein
MVYIDIPLESSLNLKVINVQTHFFKYWKIVINNALQSLGIDIVNCLIVFNYFNINITVSVKNIIIIVIY